MSNVSIPTCIVRAMCAVAASECVSTAASGHWPSHCPSVHMQVDAFTSEAFRGNPAAVCLLSSPLDDAHLQRIANELNQIVTAFVEPVKATAGAFGTHSHFKLRWFTPSTELPLCGHGTLAAAVALWSGWCKWSG